MVDAPGAGGQQRAAQRMRRLPAGQALGAGVRRQVIHHPQKGLRLLGEMPRQYAQHLGGTQLGGVDAQPLGDDLHRVIALVDALLGIQRPAAVGVAKGAQPEHPAWVGRAKAQRVFLGHQALADATGAAHQGQAGFAAAAGEHGRLARLQGAVQLPHLAQSAHKAVGARGHRRQPQRWRERTQCAQRGRGHAVQGRCDAVGQGLDCDAIVGHARATQLQLV